ncbi:hypothetical protein OQA88_4297 [Cercophora sp. LCS_1]
MAPFALTDYTTRRIPHTLWAAHHPDTDLDTCGWTLSAPCQREITSLSDLHTAAATHFRSKSDRPTRFISVFTNIDDAIDCAIGAAIHSGGTDGSTDEDEEDERREHQREILETEAHKGDLSRGYAYLFWDGRKDGRKADKDDGMREVRLFELDGDRMRREGVVVFEAEVLRRRLLGETVEEERKVTGRRKGKKSGNTKVKAKKTDDDDDMDSDDDEDEDEDKRKNRSSNEYLVLHRVPEEVVSRCIGVDGEDVDSCSEDGYNYDELICSDDEKRRRCKPRTSSATGQPSSASSAIPSSAVSSEPLIASSAVLSSVTSSLISSVASEASTSAPSSAVSSAIASSAVSSTIAPSSTLSSATSDTSSSIIVSSTLPSSIPSSSALPSSTVFVSSTLPSSNACSPTPVTVVQPATCFASVPAVCQTLNRTPTVPYPAVTVPATNCRNFFNVAATPIPEIASCFEGYASRAWNPASAYSCISNAPVYCSTTVTSVCSAATDAPAPAPTYINLAGFESGDMGPWAANTNNGGDVIKTSVSTEVTHSGTYALRTEFSNANGGSRMWIRDVAGLSPGNWELSWWWYSTNSAASTTSRVQFNGAGVSFVSDAPTKGGLTGQWVRHSTTFTAAASVGRFYFSVYGNQQDGPNVFYVDDIELRKL